MDAYSAAFEYEVNVDEEIVEASTNWGVPLPFFDLSADLACDVAIYEDDAFSRL